MLDFARDRAGGGGLELAVLTFEPHPALILRRDVPSLRLTSPKRKVELLADCGVKTVLAQRFDRAFAALEPDAFAREVLSTSLEARQVVVGTNFRFGAARSGDVSLLTGLGRKLGFEVVAMEMVEADGVGVSSSRIRELLGAGDVGEAGRLLGRPHEVTGEVIHGKGEGARLGFPTVNLGEISVMVPGPGIYAAFAQVEGAVHGAAVYTGDRPTLGHGPTCEAHLLDFTGDLYGDSITLRLVERLRGEIRFDTVEELRAQMARDVETTRRILEAEHG